jgi:hypothetical protein
VLRQLPWIARLGAARALAPVAAFIMLRPLAWLDVRQRGQVRRKRAQPGDADACARQVERREARQRAEPRRQPRSRECPRKLPPRMWSLTSQGGTAVARFAAPRPATLLHCHSSRSLTTSAA